VSGASIIEVADRIRMRSRVAQIDAKNFDQNHAKWRLQRKVKGQRLFRSRMDAKDLHELFQCDSKEVEGIHTSR
jgi:hypothetical protein